MLVIWSVSQWEASVCWLVFWSVNIGQCVFHVRMYFFCRIVKPAHASLYINIYECQKKRQFYNFINVNACNMFTIASYSKCKSVPQGNADRVF